MNNFSSPIGKSIGENRNLAIVSALIVSAIPVFWLLGKTDRVTYLGPDPGMVSADNQVPLKTEPTGNYFIERNQIYAAMKAGCRYDLNYAPSLRPNRGSNATQGQTKHVRRATLVDCP